MNEAPAPFFQDRKFLDQIWGRVQNGGITPQEGADQQAQVWHANDRALKDNGYLPPGVTREGLISRAREQAPQGTPNLKLPGQYGQAGGSSPVSALNPYQQSLFNAAQSAGIPYDDYIAQTPGNSDTLTNEQRASLGLPPKAGSQPIVQQAMQPHPFAGMPGYGPNQSFPFEI